ncbi:MAG: lysylphosphatidylglycerol synthase transmembrane domain-containing protein [Bacteroidota bacterium]
MKKQALNILKFLFFLSIGVLLIWLAFRNKSEQQINEIWISIQQADYFWLSVSIIAALLSHFFRATRWKMLLKPLGYQPKTYNTFFAVMVGYLANFAIHRIGEVTRCGLLTKYEKVPFTEGFGTVIAERAFDVICVIILFFSIFAIEFERISTISNNLIFTPFIKKCNALMANPLSVLIILVLLVIMTLVFFYFRKKIQSAFTGKLKGFVIGLGNGLKSIKNVDKPISFLIQTILIWLMYVLQAYVCFFAFDGMSDLPFVAAIVIIVFGSLAVVAVPGGTGAYQIIVTSILTTVYLVSTTTSDAYAWAVWGVQFLLILFAGLVSLVMLAILNKNVK